MTDTGAVEPLVFDWHAEQRLNPDSLLPYLVVTGMARDEQFEVLSALTDRFTNCELAILLNGVPLDVRKFLDGIAMNMAHAATAEARRLIAETGLDEIQEAVEDARVAVRETLIRRLARAGVDITRGED